ncbi:mRNA interferase RelE/StbE [Candidatus Magnetomoraceae bacterium gMMP-15]
MNLNWQIKWEKRAAKELAQLSLSSQKNIISKVEELIKKPYNGKALKGRWKGLWRLRIGNYRVIYTVRKSELLILVVKVAHRRESYRNAPKYNKYSH